MAHQQTSDRSPLPETMPDCSPSTILYCSSPITFIQDQVPSPPVGFSSGRREPKTLASKAGL